MTYTYPEITTIDTFYTNSEGYLITPETLPYGKGYSVVEVQAPYGYVLDSTPIYFDITAENTSEENGVKEISTDNHYILSDIKYPVVFEYAGQDTATVHISVNDGELIENEIIYGTIKGLKMDRETGENIAGALFGLFGINETEFTEEGANK